MTETTVRELRRALALIERGLARMEFLISRGPGPNKVDDASGLPAEFLHNIRIERRDRLAKERAELLEDLATDVAS